jgi:hypothetical protein
MTFQAYCPYCEKTVRAFTLLGGNELQLALENNGDIQVVHTPETASDHMWRLNRQEKEHLHSAFSLYSLG